MSYEDDVCDMLLYYYIIAITQLPKQTLAEFEQEYAMRAAMGRYDTVDARFRIYDAMWALALALNETMTMVNTVNMNISETGCEAMEGSIVPLDEFEYSNALMSCLIQWNIQRTNFSGVSVCHKNSYISRE